MDNRKDFIIDQETECEVELSGPDRATHALYNAIAANDIEVALAAIAEGADVNAMEPPCAPAGGSPLDCAVYWSDFYGCTTEMIDLLKAHKATQFDPENVEFIEKAEKCPAIMRHLRKKK